MDAHREDEALDGAPEAMADFRGGLIAAAVGALAAAPLGPEAWENKASGQEPDADDWDAPAEATFLPSPLPLMPVASSADFELPEEAEGAAFFAEAPESVAPMGLKPLDQEGHNQLDQAAVAPPQPGSGPGVVAQGNWWAGEAAPEWAPEGIEPEPASPPAELDPIALTLAPFFHQGYVPRRSAPRLMDPEVRAEAERRLNSVGLSLAWSPYSRHVGLSLAEGTSGGRERITNLRELDRNALALLVILWARLVLPQRLAAEGREGGVSDPVVSFEALNAEFGKKLGGRRFEMYLAQLKRLGFLEYTRKDELRAGPFLDLLGDAQQLASYLRQSALAHLLRGVEGDAVESVGEEDEADTAEDESMGEAVAEKAAAPEWRMTQAQASRGANLGG